MQDLKLYWRKIRQLESELKRTHPNGIHLSTLATDNGVTPGLIKLALPFAAAQCLVNGTHVVATPDQVEAWQVDQERERRHIEARRRWAADMPDVFVVNHAEAQR